MVQLFFHILFNLIISFLFIYAMHSVWDHLKNSYSVKKTKDLASIQSLKFQEMIDTMNTPEPAHNNDTLKKDEIEKLNADLEDYINSQVAEFN